MEITDSTIGWLQDETTTEIQNSSGVTWIHYAMFFMALLALILGGIFLWRKS
ncbi:MAG: hypothetical protein JNL36_07660 [Candidatus Kapabacteria bacterium]|nr:hypothetical protein [Candidatus Kapabacteria bacterium]